MGFGKFSKNHSGKLKNSKFVKLLGIVYFDSVMKRGKIKVNHVNCIYMKIVTILDTWLLGFVFNPEDVFGCRSVCEIRKVEERKQFSE